MKHILKTSMLFLVLFFCNGIQTLSAQTLKDVFKSSETQILYLGIDYTQARLINATTGTGVQVRDFFTPINELVINEPKKYDIQGAFNKSSMNNSLGIIKKRNEKMNAGNIISTESSDYSRLKEEDISNLVKGIDFENKKGLGLLFVVEAMTIVDMGAGKMLMTERMEGETGGGFGFRNYWASTIFDVIETINKKKYKEWKRKYGE
jgi:hypothetical protein